MKRKLIEINECSMCPYSWQFALSLECGKMDARIIPDALDIPDWCPLPDANSVEQAVEDGLAKLRANLKDLPPEFSKVVDDNFWDLI